MTETEDVMKIFEMLVVVLALIGAMALPVDAAKVTQHNEVTVATTAHAPVNINTAGVKELMTLEGIGEKVAEKIVEYRAEHGPFAKPEEIRKVHGVGGGLWEKNRDRIVVK
jgi:competence protein ComEA